MGTTAEMSVPSGKVPMKSRESAYESGSRVSGESGGLVVLEVIESASCMLCWLCPVRARPHKPLYSWYKAPHEKNVREVFAVTVSSHTRATANGEVADGTVGALVRRSWRPLWTSRPRGSGPPAEPSGERLAASSAVR